MASPTSRIGSATNITGNVSGRGALSVGGSIKGDVSIDGALEIHTGASVIGNVNASSVELGGELQGDVTAPGQVSLGAQSSYAGVIRASGVSITPGARVAARLEQDFDLHLNI